MENKFNIVKKSALEVIKKFPKAKNWKNYLSVRNWRKLFFDIFCNKYWLLVDWTKYSDLDIARRVRLVEFFDCFVKNYEMKFDSLNERWKIINVIESEFYRMVVLETWGKNTRLELLSFYHYK